MNRLLLTIAIIIISVSTFAQSARQYSKAGKEFIEAKNYKDAIEQFSKAIALAPKEADYYMLRAKAYEKNNNLSSAYDDVIRALAFDKDVDNYFEAGLLAFSLKRYDDALTHLDKVLEMKKSRNDAFEFKVRCFIAKQAYKDALPISEAALKNKETAANFYLNAVIWDNLGDFEKAQEAYTKAIKEDKKYETAYVALANLQTRNSKIDDASKNISSLIQINPNNIDAYIERSRIFVKKMDFPSAINDISKAIIMRPEDDQLYFIRGQYYQQFTQHQNAINDFNKVLMINNKNAEAYYQRASSYEQIANFKAAIKDYEALAALSENDVKARKLLDTAKKRLFELNRESNPPVVKLIDPEIHNKSVVQFAKNLKEATIKGHITDESEIDQLQINGKVTPFVKGDDGYDFIANVNIDNVELIDIVAGDIYNSFRSLFFR